MWTINYKYIVVVSGFVFILYLYPTDKQPPSDANMNIHTTAIKTTTVATQTAHTVKTQTTQTDSTIQTKTQTTQTVHTTKQTQTQTPQTVHTTKQTRQTKNAHTQVEFDMTDFIIVDYCHKV